MSKLTNKQAAFCQEYIVDHNGQEAAVRAGYKSNSARITACKMLTKANIKAEIGRLTAEIRAENIATRKQRQSFWTTVYSDSEVNMGDRLRASELLGKSEADFTEVIHTTGDAQRELDAKEQAEARRISLILLNRPKEAIKKASG